MTAKQPVKQKTTWPTWLPLSAKFATDGTTLEFTQPPRVLCENPKTARIQQAIRRCLLRFAPRSPVNNPYAKLNMLADNGAPSHSGSQQPELRIRGATAPARWPVLGADESYQLQTNSEGVVITANTEWGTLHGLETLAQLIRPTKEVGWLVPAVTLKDAPAYPWRGLCLDVCRHWFGPDAIHRVLDGMATERLNVLHLHLSNDQAFRLALPSLVASAEAPQDACLTQKDVASLVAHAAHLGIRLVPEIDLPGHSTALLAIYPELAAEAQSFKPSKAFGQHAGCIDPSRERTYDILERLLTELAAWFPDQHVHMGGDEIDATSWLGSQRILNFMQEHGLADANALQAYFHKRLWAMLKKLDKTMVLWDEALHPDLPADVIIQCWRGVAARDLALAANHPVLFSSAYYLDLNYAANIHYGFDPGAPSAALRQAETNALAAPDLADIRLTVAQVQATAGFPATADEIVAPQPRMLGGEACLWSELVDEACLDTRLFSRLPAIAERFWLGPQVGAAELQGLYRRLLAHWLYLEAATDLRPLTSMEIRLQKLADIPAAVVPALIRLLICLEPVKWYQRLLGDALIKARAAGKTISAPRPYDTTTALNRAVDLCPPESLVAIRLAELLAEWHEKREANTAQTLRQLALCWQQQAESLAGVRAALVQEIRPLSTWLGRCGHLLEEFISPAGLSQDSARHYQQELAAMQETVGELKLAVLPMLAAALRCEIPAKGDAPPDHPS